MESSKVDFNNPSKEKVASPNSEIKGFEVLPSNSAKGELKYSENFNQWTAQGDVNELRKWDVDELKKLFNLYDKFYKKVASNEKGTTIERWLLELQFYKSKQEDLNPISLYGLPVCATYSVDSLSLLSTEAQAPNHPKPVASSLATAQSHNLQVALWGGEKLYVTVAGMSEAGFDNVAKTWIRNVRKTQQHYAKFLEESGKCFDKRGLVSLSIWGGKYFLLCFRNQILILTPSSKYPPSLRKFLKDPFFSFVHNMGSSVSDTISKFSKSHKLKYKLSTPDSKNDFSVLISKYLGGAELASLSLFELVGLMTGLPVIFDEYNVTWGEDGLSPLEIKYATVSAFFLWALSNFVTVGTFNPENESTEGSKNSDVEQSMEDSEASDVEQSMEGSEASDVKQSMEDYDDND